MNTLCYIALGSNLNDPRRQLVSARRALSDIAQIQVIAVSGLYASKPMGPQDQPDYLNAVIAIETTLEPLALLDTTQAIEQQQGRVRKAERWGPRTLDLDILLFGQQILDFPRLCVPHYGLQVREFVVLPLAEIAPSLVLPDGVHIAKLAKQIKRNGLYRRETAQQWTH
ncbi:2-amino-4-hydroxy-6-hydroxymethyldihydropteridine diphosphokinase [Celerinatantimonas diazotrophica]|uniref:2-amino-4-hydroxy-6-hydroxymethyldihydropteridine pyrophosphokinase n=1 Tax=Celerinatantimonas diazotrophica TaxID=412034 RepID=A0A4R1J8T7_9GAMM|nr:2-amino-4-hydroxy-6-hydroxymethyldihydropteridine diphosphokinase [Celerinatantimonas diazotrophica]TCK46910.1 2-amino-4-hydroxy-6-hydroxymethyldihydropteridine diphosphokinase [Celerinatantimonas diazotrophica]CAG9295677.1 2-amino-4-hydroxy-6-hydroxymethyldihydropteridinepyrophosphokinase [Celerinatantimonas diazotrophica]